jgi:hypothetical protein
MDKVQKFSSKIYLTTTITFVGLVAAIITIYTFYFQKSVTRINYEIVTNSNVFDINTNISKLDILYDSTSLKQKNENLRVISIRIKNVGNVNILKTFYDSNSPLGLKILNGYLVETPELVETSNDYLKDNLSIYRDSSNCILFSSVILEQEEFFEIKFLVLHKTDETPEILPIGKIAGIKEIKVINSSEVVQETSFWSKVFIGNVFVQLVKGIIYFIVVVLLIIASVALSEFITSRLQLKKKRKLIKDFKENSKYKHKKIDDAIFENFEEDGLKHLKRMFGILADEKGINESHQRWQEILKVKEEKEAVVKDYVSVDDITLPNGYKASRKDERENHYIEMLIDEGFIISNNEGLIVNRDLKKTLENFIEFLKQSNYKENHSPERIIYRDEEISTMNMMEESSTTANTRS